MYVYNFSGNCKIRHSKQRIARFWFLLDRKKLFWLVATVAQMTEHRTQASCLFLTHEMNWSTFGVDLFSYYIYFCLCFNPWRIHFPCILQKGTYHSYSCPTRIAAKQERIHRWPHGWTIWRIPQKTVCWNWTSKCQPMFLIIGRKAEPWVIHHTKHMIYDHVMCPQIGPFVHLAQ